MRSLHTASGWLVLALFAATIASCTFTGSNSTELFTSMEQSTAAAGTNAAVPGYYSGVVPWEPEAEQVVSVVTAPAAELSPGDGKMTMSIAGVPFTAPEDHFGKSSSALASGLEFYASHFVAESEVQGLTIDPTEGVAYACYELELGDEPPCTIGLAWYNLPTEMSSYVIGIGDEVQGGWHWYSGPDDGVLTFDPTHWPGNDGLSGRMLVCVALCSGLPADFMQLKSGVSEVRGTGLEHEDTTVYPAPLRETSSRQTSTLPSLADLRPFAPPISNQGAMGSCTAFACNDAALNILLAQLYSTHGWDKNLDDNRTSPMWSYVKSGIPPIGSWNPLCGSSVGRYMSQAFNVLVDPGTAVETTVPYYATESCSTSFPVEASTEAALLQADSWYYISSSTIVADIKDQLAMYNRPVVIAMFGLEYSFLNYSGGVYHYGGTQGVNGGHAMCIVGYDDSIQAFDVRNSWGGSWGLGGYWWCGYDAAEDLAALGRFDAFYMTANEDPEAIVFFLDGTPTPDYDEVEPNNAIPQASSLPAFDFAGYSANLSGEEQYDYFAFNHAGGSNTTITVFYNASQVQPGVTLRDGTGGLLATASGSGGTLTISGVWSSSGTAYLEVARVSGSGDYTVGGAATLLPPDAPTGVNASDGTSSSAITVSWNSSTCATSYQVQRSDSHLGPYSTIGTTYDLYVDDHSAELWQEYWYRVLAVGAEGFSLPSTPDSGYLAAPSPTGVNASDGEFNDQVHVSWQELPGATAYIVKRSLTADGRYSSLGQYPGPSMIDLDVMPGQIYHYVVCAMQDGAESAPSEPDSGYAVNLALPTDAEVDESSQDNSVTPVQPVEGSAGDAGQHKIKVNP